MVRLPGLRVELRPQHYVQACAHTAIFLYWGWYWRPVYDAVFFIAAQLVFAYAFDMSLTWLRANATRSASARFRLCSA